MFLDNEQQLKDHMAITHVGFIRYKCPVCPENSNFYLPIFLSNLDEVEDHLSGKHPDRNLHLEDFETTSLDRRKDLTIALLHNLLQNYVSIILSIFALK
jgi:hypothetical protein